MMSQNVSLARPRTMDGIISRSVALPANNKATPNPIRPLMPVFQQSSAAGMDGIRLKPVALPTPMQVLETSTFTAESEGIRWRWISMGMIGTAIALSALVAHNVYISNQPLHSLSRPAAVKAAIPDAGALALAQAGRVQQTLTAGTSGKPISVVVINLKTGQSSNVNGDKQFVSASLYKLFVALAVYKQIDTGTLTLNALVPDTGQSVGSCLGAMITISDNNCGEALGTLVGWERQNSDLHSLGFSSTFLQRGSDQLTSATDVAKLYRRLYDGTLLSPNSSTNYLNLLKTQQINNRIPSGLPAGTVVAHKTGDLNTDVHDAGIVYSPGGDYVISLLSDSWQNINDAAPSLASLSAQVYKTINPPALP